MKLRGVSSGGSGLASSFVVVSGHLGRHGLSGGADRLAMATDGQTQRFAQVLEKMPTVGDLRASGAPRRAPSA
ncbi:hypothetical protein X750_28805 [Mesorhizobium sp. LNJC394B00]|nr:hypothetical protein X750_28805 [Mesorhizobium sp. LNJC394B00]